MSSLIATSSCEIDKQSEQGSSSDIIIVCALDLKELVQINVEVKHAFRCSRVNKQTWSI